MTTSESANEGLAERIELLQTELHNVSLTLDNMQKQLNIVYQRVENLEAMANKVSQTGLRDFFKRKPKED
jgi:hypothetical protein